MFVDRIEARPADAILIAMRRLLRILLLLLICATSRAAPVALPATGGEVELASAVEFLEDASKRLTLDDVREPAAGGNFRAIGLSGTDINFGYSSSAYWLRFTVVPPPGGGGDWMLEVAFPSLDSVEYFGPRGEVMVAGDLLPFAARPVANRNFVFPVVLDGDGPQTIHLRITSAGTLTVPLRLWRADAFQRHNQDAYAAQALYIGLMLALMIYNLMLYFSIRVGSYLTYVLFAGSMVVGQLSLNGFGNEYLWPDWPAWGNIAFPVGFAATGFFAALFARSFLDTQRHAPNFDAAILGMAVIFAFCAVASLVLPYRYAAIQTSLSGVIFAVVIAAAAIRCHLRGHAGARWFLLAWAALLPGICLLGMRNLGWLPTTFLTRHALQIGSALEMLLLSFALADRINILRHEKNVAMAATLVAEQKIVANLERSERELEERIADRTRDLEEANARLRDQERRLQTMVHGDGLTGLGSRLLLDARLEQAMQHARRDGESVGLLLVDVDRFKAINDQYGHAIGDEALREVANRLRKSVREVDTVARLGGDEFVIVLAGLRDGDDAFKVAEKVVADMARPFRVLGLPLDLGASVGIALYLGDAISADELLRRAGAAMQEAKIAGRGCFRLFAAG